MGYLLKIRYLRILKKLYRISKYNCCTKPQKIKFSKNEIDILYGFGDPIYFKVPCVVLMKQNDKISKEFISFEIRYKNSGINRVQDNVSFLKHISELVNKIHVVCS